MTEAEWLACTNVVRQNEFLTEKGRSRKLQLFLCSCCRHAFDNLSDKDRKRVSRMATYLRFEPTVQLGDIWQVVRHTVGIAERFADGLANENERRVAAETAQTVAQHYGDLAASAPFPGEDLTYDDA